VGQKVPFNAIAELLVLMKININGDRAVVNLKRTVRPKDWNTPSGRMWGNSKTAKQLNELIDTLHFKSLFLPTAENPEQALSFIT
jgi:hypothetical protein